uniref:Uncharacterized protein n=1 Tax=viral metagenome TaxID=1070528 RepID=A0A6C0ECH1_9ZZZZ
MINNNYYNKYIKYKDKYHFLKQLKGGETPIEEGKKKINILPEDLFAISPFKYFFIKSSVLTELKKNAEQLKISDTDVEYYVFDNNNFFEILKYKSYYLNQYTNSLSLIMPTDNNTIEPINLSPIEEAKIKEQILHNAITSKLAENKEKIDKLITNSKISENDSSKSDTPHVDLYNNVLFERTQTNDKLKDMINYAIEDIRKIYTDLYPDNERCEYMNTQIEKILSDFKSEIDSTITKTMLTIDAIIKNKNICVQRVIALDKIDKFTSLAIKDPAPFNSIKAKIDKAFKESFTFTQQKNKEAVLELTGYVIQVISHPQKNAIIIMQILPIAGGAENYSANDNYESGNYDSELPAS